MSKRNTVFIEGVEVPHYRYWCHFLTKKCKAGCDNYICRAYFPEKQPNIMKNDVPNCMGGGSDCLIKSDGADYQIRRRKERIGDGCPFVYNQCDGCKEWWCHGRTPPFKIANYQETDYACKTDEHKACDFYTMGVNDRLPEEKDQS